MATKTDFTEEEWKAMQKGITGAGMLASLSDRDFTDSFGEASALAKFLSSQRGTNASVLMQELSTVKSTGFGFGDSPQEVESETLVALGTALAALSAKAPDEVAAYRELVLGAAQRVAEAKGGMADSEAAAIARLEAAFATS